MNQLRSPDTCHVLINQNVRIIGISFSCTVLLTLKALHNELKFFKHGPAYFNCVRQIIISLINIICVKITVYYLTNIQTLCTYINLGFRKNYRSHYFKLASGVQCSIKYCGKQNAILTTLNCLRIIFFYKMEIKNCFSYL